MEVGAGRIEEVLWRYGGVATRAALVRAVSRREFDAALREGRLIRDGHGRYAAPHARDALRRANALTAVLGLRSAAAYWGLALKARPEAPDLLVPRTRKVPAPFRVGVTVHWIDTSAEERRRRVTTAETTVTHCLRLLPYDEALTVADSALRSGLVTRAHLIHLSDLVRGPGAVRARRIARAASPLAANPFESILRATCHHVRGLQVQPQVTVITSPAPKVVPDLVDVRRRLVIEAESFEWHGERAQLRRDCRRSNRLVLAGWRVLRFTWEDVMFRPEEVRAVLEAAVASGDGVPGHAELAPRATPAA